jgi:hypothetical protein
MYVHYMVIKFFQGTRRYLDNSRMQVLKILKRFIYVFQVCAESTTVIGRVFALIHAKEEVDTNRKIKRRFVNISTL